MRSQAVRMVWGAVVCLTPMAVSGQELLTNPSLEFSPGSSAGPHTSPAGWTLVETPRVPEQAGPYRSDFNNSGVPAVPCPDNTRGCGAVDAADYTVWRDNLGTNFSLPNRHPQLTGPVNQFDHEVWVADFDNPRTADLAQPGNFSHLAFPFDDGEWHLWFEPYNGTNSGFEDNEATLSQTVPGTPGLNYTMSGWALFENYFPGGVTNLNAKTGSTPTGAPFDDGPLSPTDTFFGLDFLDTNGSVLPGSVQIELKAAGQPSNTTWMQHTLSAVAPTGTTNVRVRATMTDGVTNPLPSPQVFQMSFFVDAFSLTASGAASSAAVPEPQAMVTLLGALAVLPLLRRR